MIGPSLKMAQSEKKSIAVKYNEFPGAFYSLNPSFFFSFCRPQWRLVLADQNSVNLIAAHGAVLEEIE